MSEHHRFRSMGCEIVAAGASSEGAARIAALFDRNDRVFSRFKPDSELNRVNRARGRIVRVSPLFAAALRAALDAAAATDGLVDPTVGSAIEAAGYTLDFSELAPDSRPPCPGVPGSWRSLRLAGSLLFLPRDVKLDLNGVVKALTVDEAVELIGGDGFVSAGGDLAARGELDVALPGGDALRLVRGAVATSGRSVRSWLRGGRLQHHLIDPRTGLPADSPWEQVTVCAGTCLDADVAAKAAFLLGEAGPDWLDARGRPGRFLTSAGDEAVNETWRRSLAGAPACT